MPAKKAVAKQSTRRPAPTETPWGRVEILLEEIKSQNRSTLESLTALIEDFRNEIDEKIRGIHRRLDVLEAAVRQNSRDIMLLKAAVMENSADIRELKRETAELKREMSEVRIELSRVRTVVDQKAQASAVAEIDTRVTALEVRAGIKRTI